jgi:20S proteasome alpha/beta subunit
MAQNLRAPVRVVIVLIVGCYSICSFANESPVGDQSKKGLGVSRGTINIFLANQNGIVVLTDSRLTNMSTMQPLPDPSQKLFQIDSWTVVAYAGFASEPLRMDPEVDNETARIIKEYGDSLSSHKDRRLSVREKLRQLAFILQTRIELITAINGDKPSGRNYDLEITIAGYDADGTAKIEELDLALSSTSPSYSVAVSPPHEQIVQSRLCYTVRGIRDVAIDVLTHPDKYQADPAVAVYEVARRGADTVDYRRNGETRPSSES